MKGLRITPRSVQRHLAKHLRDDERGYRCPDVQKKAGIDETEHHVLNTVVNTGAVCEGGLTLHESEELSIQEDYEGRLYRIAESQPIGWNKASRRRWRWYSLQMQHFGTMKSSWIGQISG